MMYSFKWNMEIKWRDEVARPALTANGRGVAIGAAATPGYRQPRSQSFRVSRLAGCTECVGTLGFFLARCGM